MAKTSQQFALQLRAMNKARLQFMMRMNEYNSDYHAALMPHQGSNVGDAVTNPGPQQLALESLAKMQQPVNLPKEGKKEDESSWMDAFYQVPVIGWGAWAGKKAFETGPGKTALDILSRGNYASANAALEHGKIALDRNDPEYKKGGHTPLDEVASSFKTLANPDVYEAFWKGLKGEEKTTYADVIKQQNPGSSPIVQGVGGFAADVLADPTTYIPGGAIAKLSKQGVNAAKGVRTGTKAVEALDDTAKIADDIAANEKIVTPTAEKVIPEQVDNVEAVTKPLQEVATKPVEVPGNTDFFDGLQADELIRAIESTTIDRSSLRNLPAPFKEATEEIEERVPKTVYDEVDTPVEKVESDPNAAKLARLRAIKLGIMQKPDYRIGNHRVADLVEMGKQNPDMVPGIEKAINTEAKRLYREGTADIDLIRFSGRSGGVSAGLTIDQAAKMLERGEIPKVNTTGDFTKNYPLHDIEDLDNLFMSNIKGEKVSIRDYLEGLGVKITQVSEKQPFRFDFEKAPATVKRKVARTVYETTKKQVTKSVGLEGDELKSWLSGVEGTALDASEIKYLREAKNVEEFNKRLSELAAKQVAGNFKTLDELEKAFNQGLVPKEAIEALFKIAGVKTAKQLREKVTKILEKTGEKKKPKVERLTSIDENDPWMTPKTDTPPVAKSSEEFVKELEVNPAATKKEVPAITPERLEDLSKVLPIAIVKNLVDPQDVSKYPFLSGRKLAKRTSEVVGEGKGRNLKGWHKYSQMDTFKALIGVASKRHKVPAKGNISPAARRQMFQNRSIAMFNEVMTGMRLAEAALKNAGVKFIAGVDNSGVLLSAVDVLDSVNRNTVRNYLFRPPGANVPTVQLTGLMDAVESLAKGHMGQLSPELAQSSALAILRSEPGIAKLAKPDVEASKLLKELNEAMPAVMTRVNANYAEEAVKLGESVTSMTDDVIENVVKQYGDPNISMTDAFNTFADRYKDIAARGHSVKAPTDAYKVARDKTDLVLGEKLSPGDFAEAAIGQDMAKAATVKEAAKVGTKQFKSRKEEALAELGETDMSDKFEASLHAALFRSEIPLLGKVGMVTDVLGQAFVSQWRHKDLHDMLHRERNVVQSLARSHRALMQNTWQIAQHGAGAKASETIQEAFRHMQGGTIPADQVTQAVMDSMKNSIGLMFSSGNGKLDYATRNGLFADHLNDVMKYYGVPEEYMFKEGVPISEQTDAWRNWADVEDPLDLLDKVHASMQRATVEVTLGRSFSEEFGSAVKKDGFVKITDERNRSKAFRFIDSDLYYPRDIAEQFKYLDSALKGTMTGTPSGNLGSILRKYDSILHAWKSGVTIYRPGHHVRNLIGDLSLSFFAGVNDPRVYQKALRVMASRGKAYEDWDGLKALETQSEELATGVAKTRVKINGKKVAIDDDKLWRLAFDQGILPDYRVLEDISFNSEQIGKIGGVSLTKPFGGRVQKFFGGLSQSRDHYIRLAHFIHDIEKGSYKTLDEAANAAGKQVRKWHPDGSDLTSFERNVMRRLIPFYSWVRKAIPLVVETTVMKPGKAMIFPKAMYNFAIANGLDPNSLSDPFPQDQLFPNFLSDQLIGPQWKGNLFGIPGFGSQQNRYYGMNPGEPLTDIGSSYLGANPQDAIAGGITPLLKIPIELQTGTNLGTSAGISDWSEYWDQQIPGVGYIGNITGTSPTGGFEPKQNIQKGLDQPGMNQMGIANFLSGLGLKDYSKPNYIRRAQFELLDKLRAEHGQ